MTVGLVLILASRSSRRAKLLSDAGYRCCQVDPLFEDPATPEPRGLEEPQSLAMDLATQKARSVLGTKRVADAGEGVIVGADTIVVGPRGEMLGQPIDCQDAKRMLLSLINATHRVYTGVAMLGVGGQRGQVFYDDAWVKLGDVTPACLQDYLESGQWRGKAGGYNLFDLQHQWPFTVTGDPTTVVGLPMKKLAEHLAAWSTQA